MHMGHPYRADEAQRQRLSARLDALGMLSAGAATVPRELLGQVLAAVHASVARHATAVAEPAVARVWPDYARLAASYLARSTPRGSALPDELMLRTLVIGWLVRHHARRQPLAVLGLLYGLAVVQRRLSQAEMLAAPEDVVAWEAFSGAVDQLPLDQAEQRQVIQAAQVVLGDLTSLVAALDPRSVRPLRQLVSVLNPAAGNHPIPNTIEEIAAAVRAGEQSWAEFPYYGLRYATRGIRYTWSDSAWLVSLCGLSQAELDSQIAWLGGVLAARGMPRWLLERHLEVLYAELARAIPSRASAYAPLLAAAQMLKAQRQALLGDNISAQLAASFDALVGPELAAELPQTGWLIAAAVADERAGISNARASLAGWLTDPARFSAPWVRAVRQTMQTAQKHAAKK
jgi:hypothetical protein